MNRIKKQIVTLRLLQIAFILSICYSGSVKGQMDSIVIWNPFTHIKKDTLVKYDPSIVCSNLTSNIGSWGNKINLDLFLPDSLIHSFSHNRLVKNDFNTLSYPIRVNVGIMRDRYTNNHKIKGSGILIAPNAILTAGHLIGYEATNSITGKFFHWSDSIVVSPSHEDGNPQPDIGAIRAKKCYVFKNFVNGYGHDIDEDLGLIILEKPIGYEIGWMGVGWVGDNNFLKKNLFYNFSYPGVDEYNGFNMYYKYGQFSFSSYLYGEAGTNVGGIPGESGSGFFYTDNGNYTVYGIRTYSSLYTLITEQKFRIIKALLDQNIPAIHGQINTISDARIFPNPAHDHVRIDGLLDQNNLKISIYNSVGQSIPMPQKEIMNGDTFLNIEKLTNGLYVMVINDGYAKISMKFLKQ